MDGLRDAGHRYLLGVATLVEEWQTDTQDAWALCSQAIAAGFVGLKALVALGAIAVVELDALDRRRLAVLEDQRRAGYRGSRWVGPYRVEDSASDADLLRRTLKGGGPDAAP